MKNREGKQRRAWKEEGEQNERLVVSKSDSSSAYRRSEWEVTAEEEPSA
jgi:hypothetical protein